MLTFSPPELVLHLDEFSTIATGTSLWKCRAHERRQHMQWEGAT